MGQKTHPIGFRVGVTRPWDSRWFDERHYAEWLHEDIHIRDHVKKALQQASVSRVEIERVANKLRVIIHTARPGVVIGRGGASLQNLQKELRRLTRSELFLDVVEVRRPELDAQLVAQNLAMQIERRIAFRRAMKKAVQSSMRAGAKGVRVACSGRLGGSEIARTEWYREGQVPLQKLRANIDYGEVAAQTTYGKIGCKVWIYRGDILPAEKRRVAPRA